MKKEVKIIYVAKTGGIKIDGEEGYLNPTDKCKLFVKKGMEGCVAELDMSEDGKTFSFIKVLKSPAGDNTQPPYKSESMKYDQNNAPDWAAKDLRICRQNVLNRAVDMFIADKIKREEIIDVAMSFEAWIYDKKTD